MPSRLSLERGNKYERERDDRRYHEADRGNRHRRWNQRHPTELPMTKASMKLTKKVTMKTTKKVSFKLSKKGHDAIGRVYARRLSSLKSIR